MMKIIKAVEYDDRKGRNKVKRRVLCVLKEIDVEFLMNELTLHQLEKLRIFIEKV